MPRNVSSHFYQAPCGAPFFRFLALLGLFLAVSAFAADDVMIRQMAVADFQLAHEALVESIESEGLKVREVIPFNQMLERTAASQGRPGSPFVHAEIVQFCSTALSWQMLEEDATQIAMCPLSIAVFMKQSEQGKVTLAWRLPGAATAGRQKAGDLLRRLAERAVDIVQRRH
jgi:hypothetical protein